ncbi:MAG TPA: RNA 2',3'-cyclic phosphodiesterase [Burkholderiaceae bacterium]|nr:RNA 2',3'-cyclic phosphodiesterase [Burkholderiaceae bacterium]
MSSPSFEQAPLAGMPRRRSDRLFFAIQPDARAAARIERLARDLRGDLGLRGALIERERLHVTLFFVGDFPGIPDGAIELLSQIAGRVADVAPFKVGFDRVASFPRKDRRRPLVLQGDDGVLAVTALHERLHAAMSEAGLVPPAPGRYTPHLTLLYDDRTVDGLMIDPIIWTVREFVLVHSLIGRKMHRTVARVPLHG